MAQNPPDETTEIQEDDEKCYDQCGLEIKCKENRGNRKNKQNKKDKRKQKKKEEEKEAFENA